MIRKILLWMVALCSIGYLLPGVLASLRRHPAADQPRRNNMFGWTIIGWFWSLFKSAGATYTNVRMQ